LLDSPAPQVANPAQLTLRRLDWRFLLPHPPDGQFRHLRLYGGPPGLAGLVVATGLAERVTDRPAPAAVTFDAVAILSDSNVTLAQATAGLAPGGVVYQEVARRSLAALRLTPAAIRRRLAQAGLTPTGLYWAAPSFDQCRRYIPLDVPAALRWYVSALFVAGTPLHRLVQTLLEKAVGGHGSRLGWFVPCMSVTAVAADSGAAAELPAPSVLNRPEIRRILPKPGLRPLILTSRQDDASRLVILPFAPAAPEHTTVAAEAARPEVIIKIATHPAYNRATELEQVVLQTLHDRLDRQLRQSIPDALGGFRYGDLAVSVEGVAPGQSLWVSSGGWGTSPAAKISDLTLGVRWLTEFHAQTQVERRTWDEQAIAAWVEAPLAAYASAYPVLAGEPKLFAALQGHARSLIGATLPLAWQHHDYAPWNLYRAGEKFTVIDWEFNRGWDQTQAGPGLCDLLYFVSHWYIIAHHLFTVTAEVQGLQDLFLRPEECTPTLRAARQAIADYLAAHTIDRRFVPLLLVYTWVERALYAHVRARSEYNAAAAKHGPGKYTRYLQSFANHAETLFATAHLDRLLG
jgi:hypothetical protein